ncbi:unnamed protein product [Pleuronectes platessa]|uniref:Uncharacterized protein n=1 Tax=Pleuronectes platessa TaxID=8262 RepID=A0A9N7TKC8_PLEPL|nr:unnamed protein product [Pleuronectes platessa]
MQCQDYHPFPENFIIIGTSSCSGGIGQPCLPFKSGVPQHWSLKGAVSFENDSRRKFGSEISQVTQKPQDERFDSRRELRLHRGCFSEAELNHRPAQWLTL